MHFLTLDLFALCQIHLLMPGCQSHPCCPSIILKIMGILFLVAIQICVYIFPFYTHWWFDKRLLPKMVQNESWTMCIFAACYWESLWVSLCHLLFDSRDRCQPTQVPEQDEEREKYRRCFDLTVIDLKKKKKGLSFKWLLKYV